MSLDAESSYSRLPTAAAYRARKEPPRPTRGQRAIEIALFLFAGITITLAGVALYATNRPEHRSVPNRMAAGYQADRINVLVIGSALRTRTSGSDAVDIESLTLLSIQPSTGRTAVMSLPVDLWVKVAHFGQRPLRATHTLGDASGYPGAGAGLTVDTVAEIVKQPVHGYVRVGLGDITRLIDSAGGIDVDVRRPVYDARCRKRFRRGERHLSGTEALHYAHAARDGREERQQEVMVAGLQKLLRHRREPSSFAPLLGPLVDTNLSRAEVLRIGTLLRGQNDIKRISFTPYLDAIRVNTITYRGNAVRPRGGDFTTLQKTVAAALSI